MKNIQKYIPLLLLIWQGHLLQAQNTVQTIDGYFQKLHKLKQFNGNVLVAEKGKVIYENSFGLGRFEQKVPLSKDSQFPIASISKTFTSTAVLQLEQNGKLRLDDAVQNYLPDFPYPNVTLRHLLSNTSGLGQYYHLFDQMMLEDPAKTITNADIIQAFIRYKTPLSFIPGERWEYNNLNFCIAALVIEKVSGLSYARYLSKYIFKPAGMKNSIVPADKSILQKQQVERYSYPDLYSTILKNTHDIPENFKIDERSNFYGNGGIVSTAEDLFRFDQALYGGKLLEDRQLQAAFTPAKLNNGKPATYQLDEKEVAYGLGWEIYTDETNGKTVFHDGSITGLTSILVRNITRQKTVILLENTGSNAVFAASNSVLNILSHKPYDPARENFTRLYGSAVAHQQAQKADEFLTKYLKNPEQYQVTEREINRLGYALIRDRKKAEAVTVFRTATVLFPKSWNTFDSYGEALLLNGQKEEAIKMYRKSVELNPENENGKKVLKDNEIK